MLSVAELACKLKSFLYKFVFYFCSFFMENQLLTLELPLLMMNHLPIAF